MTETKVPLYMGFQTLSITPIYDSKYKVLWLLKEGTDKPESWFFDPDATGHRLRKIHEIPNHVSERPDVRNMLISPEEAEKEHVKQAAARLQEEDQYADSRPQTPKDSDSRPQTPTPVTVPSMPQQDVIAAMVESLKNLKPVPDISMQPPELSSDLLEQTRNFVIWMKDLELQFETQKVTEPEEKLRFLKSELKAKIVEKVGNQPWEKESDDPYQDYKARVKATLTMRHSKSDARSHFSTLEQRPNEDLVAYINRVLEEAYLCEWGEHYDEMVLNQLKNGSLDDPWIGKVLGVDGQNLTLKQAINLGQTMVSARATSRNIKSRRTGQNQINYTNQRNDQRQTSQNQAFRPDRRTPWQRNAQNDQNEILNCGYCMKDHQRGQCPAYGLVCRKCNGRNHFSGSRKCYAPSQNFRPSQPARPVTPPSSGSDVHQSYPYRAVRYRESSAPHQTYHSQTNRDDQNQTESEILSSQSIADAAVRHVRKKHPENGFLF